MRVLRISRIKYVPKLTVTYDCLLELSLWRPQWWRWGNNPLIKLMWESHLNEEIFFSFLNLPRVKRGNKDHTKEARQNSPCPLMLVPYIVPKPFTEWLSGWEGGYSIPWKRQKWMGRWRMLLRVHASPKNRLLYPVPSAVRRESWPWLQLVHTATIPYMILLPWPNGPGGSMLTVLAINCWVMNVRELKRRTRTWILSLPPISFIAVGVLLAFFGDLVFWSLKWWALDN